MSLSYLNVKFVLKKNVLICDEENKVWRCNCSTHSVSLKLNDLSEYVRCKIIAKKCLPVLMYGLECRLLWFAAVCKLHITCCKAF